MFFSTQALVTNRGFYTQQILTHTNVCTYIYIYIILYLRTLLHTHTQRNFIHTTTFTHTHVFTHIPINSCTQKKRRNPSWQEFMAHFLKNGVLKQNSIHLSKNGAMRISVYLRICMIVSMSNPPHTHSGFGSNLGFLRVNSCSPDGLILKTPLPMFTVNLNKVQSTSSNRIANMSATTP